MTIGSDGDWLRKYAAKKSSSKIYYYVCGGPKFPNTFILSNLLECRLVPILAKHLGIDGFLRWNYTVWPKDPRRELHYMFHSGDLNFVYPSRGGDVLYSLRYFALKSGIVDFELLSAARRRNAGKMPENADQGRRFLFPPDRQGVGRSRIFGIYRLCRRKKDFARRAERKNIKMPEKFPSCPLTKSVGGGGYNY